MQNTAHKSLMDLGKWRKKNSCGWNWGYKALYLLMKENKIPFRTLLIWVKILHWKAMKCFLYTLPVTEQQGGTTKTSLRILPTLVFVTLQSNPRAANTATFYNVLKDSFKIYFSYVRDWHFPFFFAFLLPILSVFTWNAYQWEESVYLCQKKNTKSCNTP